MYANDASAIMLNLNCGEQVGKMTAFEFYIKYRSDDLYNFSDVLFHLKTSL